MTKVLPENKADLYRMLQTSTGWFDGMIEHEQVKPPEADYELGMVESESTHVSTSPFEECDVVVHCDRRVVSKVRGPRACSLDVQRVWTRRLTFEDFKASEWWRPTVEKFADGSCDASEIFVKSDNSECGVGSGAYAYVTAQCERHYRDWLGNTRLAKGYDEVSLWLQGNGDMGFTLNGKTYELEVSELADLIEQVRAFEAAGITLEDGKLTVEVGKEVSE